MVRVLMEASCLVDGRRDAGIGRYARELIDAMDGVDDVVLQLAEPDRPPLSESRPGRFLHAQPATLLAATRVKPDVLHGVGGEPVAGFPALRQVVTLHDVEMWRAPASSTVRGAALRAYGAALASLVRGCGAVIAVSRTSAREAIDTLGLDPHRVHVIPEGAARVFRGEPSADDAPLLASLGLARRGYLLWTGSLRVHDPRKGLDSLVEAVARLGTDAPPLAMAGAAGAEAERVRGLAARLGCRVFLLGRRIDSELAALYRNAATAVVASTHEGFGLAALEAMACGTPVVATAAGNLPELCGPAALLVPPRDPAALAGGLRAVLEDGIRSTGMREAGLRRAADFTWERTAAETAAVYRRLARRSPRLSSSSRIGTGTSPAR